VEDSFISLRSLKELFSAYNIKVFTIRFRDHSLRLGHGAESSNELIK